MKIQVNMDEISHNAMYMKQKANEYEQTIQNIYTGMYQLQGVWQGKDNETFIRQLDSFRPQLQRLATLMEQYGHYLQTCANQYEELMAERSMAASRLA